MKSGFHRTISVLPETEDREGNMNGNSQLLSLI